ncbi:MAG: hypothetical protein KGN78_05705 [Actinomycetales bacterium]|nr:hypothetical protein [Actinomycetales bacterium]
MATISTTARPAYVYDAVGDQWVPIAWRVLPAGVGSAPALTFTGDSNTGLWSPAADTVAFSTGGSERMRIDNAGNVGIGVTGPLGKLHLSTDSATVQYMDTNVTSAIASTIALQKARGSAASKTVVSSGDGLGNVAFYGYDGASNLRAALIAAQVDATPGTNDMPGRLLFYTTADGASDVTERMRITSAGNVGIGTSNPGSNLHIEADSTAQIRTARNSTDSSGPQLVFYKRRGTSASPVIVSAEDSLGDIHFFGYDGTTLRAGALIRAAIDTTPGSGDMPGRLAFFTTPDGSTSLSERMRIDSSGNVGIGVPAPEVRLHLRAADGVQAQVAADTFINAGTSSRVLLRKARGTSGSPTVVQSGDNLGETFFQGWDGSAWRDAALVRGSVDGTPGASDMPGRLEFYTTADGSASLTERMRIDSSGNVGIGTSSPVTRLNVRAADFTQTEQLIESSAASSRITLRRVNGTFSSPTAVANGDQLGTLVFQGYDGSNIYTVARVEAVADGTTGTGDLPSRLGFYTTADGASTPTERMRIDNAGLITGTGTSLGAWTAFTPTLSGTGWAIGNGTASGFYCQVGKIVYFRAKITFGSTSTYGGSPLNLSLPVSATGSPVAGQNVAFFDTSASLRYLASMEYASATAIAPRSVSGSLTLAAVTTTAPFTWATGDTIDYSGTYEAA